MLSATVKKKIEEKAGITIRYPKDCEVLAMRISRQCGCNVSSSTLKRLFGFVKGTQEPRMYTLDIIANFLDYHCWDELVEYLVDFKKASNRIEQVDCRALKPGSVFRIHLGAVSTTEITYCEKFQFEVIQQTKTELLPGDIIHLKKIQLDLPVLIIALERQGVKTTNIILGKVTGVTKIIKIK